MDYTYSIKDLEHLSGIKAHTIRAWEQRYGILKANRTETNIRYYTSDDLKLLLNIAILKRNGVKISRIAGMSIDEISGNVNKLTDDLTGDDVHIDSLTIAMIDFDQARFEKVLSTHILKDGFEKTMLNLVYPFLEKIGYMWVAGSIIPAHEHFITNLIRQKLIVAIDGQVVRNEAGSKRFLLFLPEGELHEISLLFMNYMLQNRQQQVVYLGSNVPYSDLLNIAGKQKLDYLFTILTSSITGIQPSDYVQKLSEDFPGLEILVSGQQAIKVNGKTPANVTVFQSLQHILDFLARFPFESA